VVEVNGSAGLIDQAGNVVVEPQYVYIIPLDNGIALAHSGSDLVVLDATGQVLVRLPSP
jgi:hypothetical protein